MDEKQRIDIETLKGLITKVVDFASEYGEGFVSSIFDLVSKDDIKEIKESILLYIIDETLHQYEMSKCELFGKDSKYIKSIPKKYSRIVIVKLIRENFPTYTFGDISSIINLESDVHSRGIYKDSKELSPKIKDEKFALSVIENIQNTIKQMKTKQLKQAKTNA